ncbi:GrpE nucleotide exchange factor [Candidatus Omnitrophus magneticus]|uniref:Protein GrpE n=1 Tax=Candidatus Omnitrophus magneticus TaxID=1609969 RepID=A0A0F0CVV9_9BACT|nr:GrpE nucleotide exchange factor [Candidatus Omnitrophus magneticus]
MTNNHNHNKKEKDGQNKKEELGGEFQLNETSAVENGIGKDTITIAAKEYEEFKKKSGERDEYYNKWLGVLAEYENTKKRMERERDNSIKFANESLILRLFPIVDNFDMAISAMGKADDKTALMKGMEIVQKEFHKVLEDNGVKKINTVREKFDPHVHEAVMVIESDKYSDNAVVDEFRAGYLFNERLLRPAQVKVAKNNS